MSMIWYPEEQADRPGAIAAPAERYDIAMRVAVGDAGLLWRMSAAHALARDGICDTALEEILGPLEDPSVADCLTMMLGPRTLSGCAFETFRIVRAAASPVTGRRYSG